MKTIKCLVLLAFSLTLMVTSCKKDDKTPMTKSEMLTAKSWKLSSSKTNGVVDVLDDCDKDDFIKLASNGTYTYNPGSNKCDPSETTDTGTWSLSSDEKSIIIDGQSATIVELTESKFVYSISAGGYTYEATLVSF